MGKEPPNTMNSDLFKKQFVKNFLIYFALILLILMQDVGTEIAVFVFNFSIRVEEFSSALEDKNILSFFTAISYLTITIDPTS